SNQSRTFANPSRSSAGFTSGDSNISSVLLDQFEQRSNGTNGGFPELSCICLLHWRWLVGMASLCVDVRDDDQEVRLRIRNFLQHFLACRQEKRDDRSPDGEVVALQRFAYPPRADGRELVGEPSKAGQVCLDPCLLLVLAFTRAHGRGSAEELAKHSLQGRIQVADERAGIIAVLAVQPELLGSE